MPTLKGPIQGNRSPYSLRSGIDVAELHGINKQKDPAAIDENQFQSATNVRLRGGRMWARGGQSKFNGTAMTASCVIGIFDFLATAVNMLIAPKAGGVPLFFNSNYTAQPTYPMTFPYPCHDPSGAGPSYLLTTTFPGLFPSDMTPTGSTSARRAFHKYRGSVIAYGSDGGLYKLLVDKKSVVFPGYTEAGGATYGAVTLISELLFSPADFYATCVPNTSCEWRQKLWFASRDGHVYVWDGNTFVRDTASPLGAPTADGIIFQLFEDIYVALSNALYRRNGGAWSAVTLPGSLTDFRPHAAYVYQNNAYIAGGDRHDVLGVTNMDPVILKLASPSTCTEDSRSAQDCVGAAELWGGWGDVVVKPGGTTVGGYSLRPTLGESQATAGDMSQLYGTADTPQNGFVRCIGPTGVVFSTPASAAVYNGSTGADTEYAAVVYYSGVGAEKIIVGGGDPNGTGEPSYYDAIVF